MAIHAPVKLAHCRHPCRSAGERGPPIMPSLTRSLVLEFDFCASLRIRPSEAEASMFSSTVQATCRVSVKQRSCFLLRSFRRDVGERGGFGFPPPPLQRGHSHTHTRMPEHTPDNTFPQQRGHSHTHINIYIHAYLHPPSEAQRRQWNRSFCCNTHTHLARCRTASQLVYKIKGLHSGAFVLHIALSTPFQA